MQGSDFMIKSFFIVVAWLEQIRANKYVLNDFTSDYKFCLLKLQLLPVMYKFDLSDIIFPKKSVRKRQNALKGIKAWA